MDILELLKQAGIEIDAEKGEDLTSQFNSTFASKDSIQSMIDEAVNGLKSKNDELLGKLHEQKTAAQLAQDKADELARGKMSNEELNASWETKFNNGLAEKDKEIESILGQMQQIKVDEVVAKLSAELSDYPEAIAPHIKSRLSMERVETGEFKTVVLTDGKLSALSLDELKKELSESKTLAPLIKSNMGGSQPVGKREEQHQNEKLSTTTTSYLAGIRN
ncbi:MAG: hypothetical protein ACPGUE_14755 [Marinomonas sp.]